MTKIKIFKTNFYTIRIAVIIISNNRKNNGC